MRPQVLKERFEEVQEIVHLGFWEWDIFRNILKWSDEIYTIFEVEKNQIGSYEDFLAFVHSDDKKALESAVDDTLRGKKEYDFIHRIVTPGGTLKFLRERGRVMYDQYGEALFMLGTVQNISDTVLREQALKNAIEEAHTFRELLDKSNDAIYISDPINGRLLDFNERAQTMLGYSREELLGLSVYDVEEIFETPEDWNKHLDRLKSGKTVMAEGRHRPS